MTITTPLKLAILWHMHQPNYQEPGSNRMVLPWVRLHATKDYLDMLLTVGEYENVRVTFNLVPSLLDQLQMYVDGGSDPHLDLSRLRAEDMTPSQKAELLESFFAANQTNMIEPYRRYHELFRKARNGAGGEVLPSLFTSQEIRDLQVWSNLVWADPMFHGESPVKELLAKGRNFSEEQKQALLDWQIALIRKVVPAYRDYFTQQKVDISFTPYYHPILPLLCDTNVALEATPRLTLPSKRFCHPEDAEWHIRRSMEKFEEWFDAPMAGLWPSEGSVSEEVAEMLIRLGVKWVATDEEILYGSLKKSNMDPRSQPIHAVYEYGSGLKLFFRDHALSDRIGFVYSGWDADKAAADFVDHLTRLRQLLADRLDQTVVPVILDGENAWEYFPNDGRDFLNELYRRLNDDPLIRTVTLTEAAQNLKSRPLSSLFAGSWINHNFRIWIGHQEDNAAWDLLSEARNMLTEFEEQHADFDSDRLAAAWRQIYIAEGSDWCWWYGDEHRGAGNEQFDHIFRRHLMAVYELLGLEVPARLYDPIYRAGAGLKAVSPDALVTPEIDGRRSDFYEWAGAGYFDCLKAGGAMHRVERYLSRIHFAYDHQRLYIRLDFVDVKALELVKKLVFQIAFFTPEVRHLMLTPTGEVEAAEEAGWYQYCLGDILELAVDRSWLWEEGFGRVGFTVALLDGQEKLENWPEDEPIEINVAEKNKEMFWPA